MNLPMTRAMKSHLAQWEEKLADVNVNMYRTKAMLDRSWTLGNRANRYLVTGYAAHGYHHKICSEKRFHEPNEECICELCGESSHNLYHLEECDRPKPLTSLVK